MNRIFLPILFLLLGFSVAGAQTPTDTAGIVSNRDTIKKADSVQPSITHIPAVSNNEVSKKPSVLSWAPTAAIGSPLFIQQVLAHHPYYGFDAKPEPAPPSILRKVQGQELLFYVLVLLLIFFAVLRLAFSKYFADLFRLFFRTTLKQRQIKEQLVQTPLPSLLLNVFFFISGGFYISFLLKHYHADPFNNFWLLLLYCCVGLAATYLVKFIGLKISGWLFNNPEAADSYVFIVFIINKMIGILLLPFILFLAFSKGDMLTASLTLSWCLIAGLLGYRVILTYGAIHNQVKVNPFHFFLYLLAFEVAPLLLIYKGVLLFFSLTT